jgi:hypothetical protein
MLSRPEPPSSSLVEILVDTSRSHGASLADPPRAVPHSEVTVVIVSRGRPEIGEAIESVCRQDYTGPIRLLVLGDNWPGLLCPVPSRDGIETMVCNCRRADGGPEDPYRRVAYLRNLATTLVTTRLLCFLDDDNVWESGHLSTLTALIDDSRCVAVHSWRRLEDRHGQPVVPRRYPWLPPGPQADMLFAVYAQHGVMDPRDCVIRDRATLPVADRDYGMVDMGEWLFDRGLFSLVQFDDQGTSDKYQLHSGEDDKLLHEMRRLGIPVACSQEATLRYRLGGFSNDFNAG